MTTYQRNTVGSHSSSVTDQEKSGINSPTETASIISSLQFEFFDKEEEKRRQEYRERVEKHYCRLIEEEKLSPESASVLSDAFAEAEVKAKYGAIKEKAEMNPEYHTGIDKTVWSAIDHQRSKSLERLKSQGKQTDSISGDNIIVNVLSTDNADNIINVNMDLPTGETAIVSEIESFMEEKENREGRQFDLNVQHLSENEDYISDERNDDAEENGNVASYELESDYTDTLVESESESEFDGKEREFINKRGDMAVEKSMELWMGGVKEDELEIDQDGRLVYKDRVRQYKEKIAAKEREKIRELLKTNAAMPSASPTPMDYDADEENSYKGNVSQDCWSDDDVTSDDERTAKEELKPVCFSQQPFSSRSSVSSEKSRLDPLTYQSYTAGLLHSSGKSEKFLKLQKHFEVLERITEIEEKTRISGKAKAWMDNPAAKNELFAKYDVQSMEELQWLYQELSDAQKNAEFFYDLQRLAVYQWKPAHDFGLKKKGKSLSDLKDFYEKIDKEENDSLSNTYFQKAKQSEKKASQAANNSEKKAKPVQRALYGTNIPEKLDSFEIYVAEKKNKNKADSEEGMDNLHIRSLSAPYSKHIKTEDKIHKRSDSSKGSMFGKVYGAEKQASPNKKPQVGEVMPVQRQATPRSPVFSNISPGPHDFASRLTETASISRPMQSNLEIYNSLENPQYQASVGMEGRPVHMSRKSSLTKPHDPAILSQDLKQATEHLSRNNSLKNMTAHVIPTHDMSERTITESIDLPSVNVPANFVRAVMDDSFKLGNPDSNVLNSGMKDRRIDYSPVGSVKSVIANLEEMNDPVGPVENDSRSVHNWQVTKSRTYSDLLQNQPASYHDTLNLSNMDRHGVNPMQENRSESDKEHFTQVVGIRTCNKPPSIRTGTRQGAGFQVRDLRSLAVNNEFSKSKFFPTQIEKKSVIPDDEPAKVRLIRKDSEPKLHSPVVSQIWTGKPGHVYTDNSIDARRGSSSSTDTFIVKESDDELDPVIQPVAFVTQTQEPLIKPININNSLYSQHHITTKSKSVPELNKDNGETSFMSTKSYSRFSEDDGLSNGRHCIPRFGSGDQLDRPTKDDVEGKYISGLAKLDHIPIHTSALHKVGLTKDAHYSRREISYDAYIPPVEILKDVARNSEMYKRSEPIDKPKKPSLLGKMTLDYLHEIGSEWKSSKAKRQTRDEKVCDTEPTLPDSQPFIGSDIAASPNRWFPVKETKDTNKAQTETEAVITGTKLSHPANADIVSAASQVDRKPMMEREFQEENSLYKKYLTLPRKKGKNRPEGFKASDSYSYNTIPRVKTGTDNGVPKSSSVPGKKGPHVVRLWCKNLILWAFSTSVGTLKCLSIGTPYTTTFPFVLDGKWWLLGVPIFEHIIIRLSFAQILGHLKIINFPFGTNGKFIIFTCPNI